MRGWPRSREREKQWDAETEGSRGGGTFWGNFKVAWGFGGALGGTSESGKEERSGWRERRVLKQSRRIVSFSFLGGVGEGEGAENVMQKRKNVNHFTPN